MRNEFFNKKKNKFGLYMINCGYEDCCSGFNCPPHKRHYYLLHYVVSGIGVYDVNGKQYTVNEGDLFLIYPGELVTYYAPDIANPLSFCWIGFNGKESIQYLSETGVFGSHNETFNEKRYVLHLNDRTFLLNILNCLDYVCTPEINLSQYRLGCYILNSLDVIRTKCLKKEKLGQPSNLADRAIRYIEYNYMNGIKPHDISEYLSINRTYFYRIFKKFTHLSPEKYLMQYRISKAIELLEEGKYSITEVGRYVGINDIYYFSKLFKKSTGINPSEYTKQTSQKSN